MGKARGEPPTGRAVVGVVDAHLLVATGDALVSTAGWLSEGHDAPSGRPPPPPPPVPLSPLRREEVLGGGHFDHLEGHLGEMGEPRVAWPVGGDDCDPRT